MAQCICPHNGRTLVCRLLLVFRHDPNWLSVAPGHLHISSFILLCCLEPCFGGLMWSDLLVRYTPSEPCCPSLQLCFEHPAPCTTSPVESSLIRHMAFHTWPLGPALCLGVPRAQVESAAGIVLHPGTPQMRVLILSNPRSGYTKLSEWSSLHVQPWGTAQHLPEFKAGLSST